MPNTSAPAGGSPRYVPGFSAGRPSDLSTPRHTLSVNERLSVQRAEDARRVRNQRGTPLATQRQSQCSPGAIYAAYEARTQLAREAMQATRGLPYFAGPAPPPSWIEKPAPVVETLSAPPQLSDIALTRASPSYKERRLVSGNLEQSESTLVEHCARQVAYCLDCADLGDLPAHVRHEIMKAAVLWAPLRPDGFLSLFHHILPSEVPSRRTQWTCELVELDVSFSRIHLSVLKNLLFDDQGSLALPSLRRVGLAGMEYITLNASLINVLARLPLRALSMGALRKSDHIDTHLLLKKLAASTPALETLNLTRGLPGLVWMSSSFGVCSSKRQHTSAK
ncbi:uncharacterized protein L969DRAFT_53625 [Mixia osmundae IAM 14324]|uniref:Uncharacterized protein n=1 Tax=Mixia osmundae (strain CBS 9802 / IAM 14324 / JCM 22182 / KY 12970) TaxID=764103 RepID=G7EAZ5_MIXOS|nr:uncharacterized protein L969DRAFT_53625 [Mixia osmundae IAM 14324]KEI37040.1 hypothetical protein L969DRAFT_53625 [Mixia osmundae IAM 14324]GAB00006.1 hypothetical protein E5Q_06708 [Mixia osmundae IAM 14324]